MYFVALKIVEDGLLSNLMRQSWLMQFQGRAKKAEATPFLKPSIPDILISLAGVTMENVMPL